MTDHPYREGSEALQDIIVTTGNDVAGHRVDRYLGVVRGIVVRSPSAGQALRGGFRMMKGGNIDEFAEVCEAARHEAYERMMGHARALGAQAVIAMRYDATSFNQGSTEVLAYGTAVLVTRIV